MHCRSPVRVLAAFTALLALTPTALSQPEIAGESDSYASFEINEGAVGPNVGTQPRRARFEDAEAAEADGADQAVGTQEDSRLWIGAGVEYTTAYFSRGFLFEDDGLILQPYLDLAFDVLRTDDTTVSVVAGTWNSYQDEATDAGTTDSFRENWYETDLYLGAALATGNWSFEASYYWYTSPSDAWETIEEVYFTAAYDDSEALGAWSMQPNVLLAIETGENANDGYTKGTYLQLGVTPGFEPEDGALAGWAFEFPVSVGLSLGNYYEGDDGENDFFGFASVGATATRTLDLDDSWGEWSVYAGVQALFLGDMASTWNDDDDLEAILTVGVSVEF